MMLAALASLVLATAAPAPTAPPNVTFIYLTAIQHLATLDQPAFIDDQEHWTTTYFGPEGASTSEHFQRTLFDSASRRECILSLPFNAGAPVTIGPSYFAPDLWLIHKRMPVQSNPRTIVPDLSDLREIGTVSVVAKPSYEITLVGIDPLSDGGAAYHLGLRPLSDPARHNLRALWINSTTGDINRAAIVGEYSPNNRDTLQPTTVLEDFGRVAGYWLMIHHVWAYRPAFSSFSYQYDVTSVTMSFPSQIPAWYFDREAFSQHREQVNTTSVWPPTPAGAH